MAQIEELAEQLVKLTIAEASELADILETKYNIKPAASVAVASNAGGSASEDNKAEEQTEFSVHLENAGAKKIAVIREVRSIIGLGLKEAKDMVDGAPTVIKENVSKEDAEEIKSKLETAGASVTLK